MHYVSFWGKWSQGTKIVRIWIYLINYIIKYQAGNRMPKRFIRFNIPRAEDKKSLFLRDPKFDFTVILQKKTFQLHKQLLSPSKYFQELIAQDKKQVTISAHLNVDCFQRMLGCFYGIQATFERHNIVIYLLDILDLLRIKDLDDQLRNDMRLNFQQYGLFNLFYLSKRLKLRDIQEQCIKQLKDQEFEQINYNKYDLFQLSPELFTFILKQHQKMKAQGEIQGFDNSHIRSVCQQYAKTNSVIINVQQILKYGHPVQKSSKKQDKCNSDNESLDGRVIKKRNATWTSMPEKESSKIKLQQQDNNFQSQNKISSFEQKSNQLIKIRMINSNMQENNNKLAEQIRTVKSAIDAKERDQYPNSIDDLDKKLRQFQQKSRNAHKKMEDLKQKMIQLNIDRQTQKTEKKSQNKQSKQNNHQLSPTIRNVASTVLSQMAILKKSQQIMSDGSDQY